MENQIQLKKEKRKENSGTYQNELYQLLNTKKTNYAGRGMDLEEDLNKSNEFYRQKGIAFIYKKPTPIKLVKIDYPSKQNKTTSVKIKEAYFESPSTTDYNGIYKAKYIDFEAKETKSKTAFPLENIHTHQIEHLRNITKCGGIGFLIVRFSILKETYLLPTKDFFSYLETEKRKSIPYSFFQTNGYKIEESMYPRLDYLKIVDQLIGGTENVKK
ncbi:MAG: Holliday junction resolvase RecU [Bacilli bacterium]|nr:Holliday junction resolvase RecU [Bacilli bacterium]